MNNESIYQAAWQFAVACLWPGRRLSEFEEKFSRHKIRQIISSAPDAFLSYMDLCQRLLLFRHYAVSSKGRVTIPSPCKWFREGNGISTSMIFLKSVQQKRLSDPLYLHSQKGLCEAVLEITERESDETISYWENWFRERNAKQELWLFILYASKFSTKTFQS